MEGGVPVVSGGSRRAPVLWKFLDSGIPRDGPQVQRFGHGTVLFLSLTHTRIMFGILCTYIRIIMIMYVRVFFIFIPCFRNLIRISSFKFKI